MKSGLFNKASVYREQFLSRPREGLLAHASKLLQDDNANDDPQLVLPDLPDPSQFHPVNEPTEADMSLEKSVILDRMAQLEKYLEETESIITIPAECEDNVQSNYDIPKGVSAVDHRIYKDYDIPADEELECDLGDVGFDTDNYDIPTEVSANDDIRYYDIPEDNAIVIPADDIDDDYDLPTDESEQAGEEVLPEENAADESEQTGEEVLPEENAADESEQAVEEVLPEENAADESEQTGEEVLSEENATDESEQTGEEVLSDENATDESAQTGEEVLSEENAADESEQTGEEVLPEENAADESEQASEEVLSEENATDESEQTTDETSVNESDEPDQFVFDADSITQQTLTQDNVVFDNGVSEEQYQDEHEPIADEQIDDEDLEELPLAEQLPEVAQDEAADSESEPSDDEPLEELEAADENETDYDENESDEEYDEVPTTDDFINADETDSQTDEDIPQKSEQEDGQLTQEYIDLLDDTKGELEAVEVSEDVFDDYLNVISNKFGFAKSALMLFIPEDEQFQLASCIGYSENSQDKLVVDLQFDGIYQTLANSGVVFKDKQSEGFDSLSEIMDETDAAEADFQLWIPFVFSSRIIGILLVTNLENQSVPDDEMIKSLKVAGLENGASLYNYYEQYSMLDSDEDSDEEDIEESENIEDVEEEIIDEDESISLPEDEDIEIPAEAVENVDDVEEVEEEIIDEDESISLPEDEEIEIPAEAVEDVEEAEEEIIDEDESISLPEDEVIEIPAEAVENVEEVEEEIIDEDESISLPEDEEIEIPAEAVENVDDVEDVEEEIIDEDESISLPEDEVIEVPAEEIEDETDVQLDLAEPAIVKDINLSEPIESIMIDENLIINNVDDNAENIDDAEQSIPEPEQNEEQESELALKKVKNSDDNTIKYDYTNQYPQLIEFMAGLKEQEMVFSLAKITLSNIEAIKQTNAEFSLKTFNDDICAMTHTTLGEDCYVQVIEDDSIFVVLPNAEKEEATAAMSMIEDQMNAMCQEVFGWTGQLIFESGALDNLEQSDYSVMLHDLL